MTSPASSAWTPPESPNPTTILREAQDQTDAKRYEDALAKFEWYHKNAVAIDPGQYGVRLSFALSDWAELATVYPPALESLKKTRDEAVAKVKGDKPSREAFREAESINQYLKDDAVTADLFVWLVENRPDKAKKAYPDAEEALIRAKSYKICGPYLDPKKSYRRLVAVLDRTFAGPSLEWLHQHFSREAASLVALLAINGRQADADTYAAKAAAECYAGKAATEWPDADFAKKLEQAKQGIMP